MALVGDGHDEDVAAGGDGGVVVAGHVGLVEAGGDVAGDRAGPLGVARTQTHLQTGACPPPSQTSTLLPGAPENADRQAGQVGSRRVDTRTHVGILAAVDRGHDGVVDASRAVLLRDLLASSPLIERTRGLRPTAHDLDPRPWWVAAGRYTEEEPWHLAAHLDDESQYAGLPVLRPTLGPLPRFRPTHRRT